MTQQLDPPPLRTCPTCGHEARTRFERCPECLTSYYVTPRGVRRRRWLIGGAIGVVVVGLLTVAAVVTLGERDSNRAKARADQARAVAALRARIKRVQAPHHGADRALLPPAGATDAQRLAARHQLVLVVQNAITRDARARVKTRELDGPILNTECGPILKSKTAIPDDRVLSKRIGRYDCVAIKRHVTTDTGATVAELGHAFVAALNFDTFTYTWCRNTPAQGEAGVALVFVRLDRACLAAKGKALGTGYVDVPGE